MSSMVAKKDLMILGKNYWTHARKQKEKITDL